MELIDYLVGRFKNIKRFVSKSYSKNLGLIDIGTQRKIKLKKDIECYKNKTQNKIFGFYKKNCLLSIL